MRPAPERLRPRTSSRRRPRRLVIEPLEGRTLLTSPPFSVGGDPIVNPADFRVTTFASGLNYPHGMTTLSDGSILVAVNNPVSGSSFYNTTGELLRFTDANRDGIADGAGQVLFNGLPGEVTAVHSGRGVPPGHEQRRRERTDLGAPHRRDPRCPVDAGRQHQFLLPRQLGAYDVCLGRPPDAGATGQLRRHLQHRVAI